MSEPITTALGIKLSTIVAGFAGGVVSLAVLHPVTLKQATLAVVVGCLTATWLTPIAVYKFGLSAQMEGGTAFVIGLCAMAIIPAIYKAAGTIAASRAASVAPMAKDGDQTPKGAP